MITTTPFNFLRTVSSILKVYGQSTMSTSPREEREHSAQSVNDSECDLGEKEVNRERLNTGRGPEGV